MFVQSFPNKLILAIVVYFLLCLLHNFFFCLCNIINCINLYTRNSHFIQNVNHICISSLVCSLNDYNKSICSRSEEHTLNSSQVKISYAAFCLKKKKHK